MCVCVYIYIYKIKHINIDNSMVIATGKGDGSLSHCEQSVEVGKVGKRGWKQTLLGVMGA